MNDGTRGEQRGRTIPVQPWWRERVLEAIKVRKAKDASFTQLALAEAKGIDPGALSNYLKGTKMPVLEHAIAISDALELPYPVIIPISFEEAEHLMEQRRLWKSDVSMREIEIASGLTEDAERDQTGAVTSQNGPQPRRKTNRRRSESSRPGRRRP